MATLYVTHNAPGGGDGSMGNPMTIDEAVAMISVDGHEIRLGPGAYDRLAGLNVLNHLIIGCKSGWVIPTIDEPPPVAIEFSAPGVAAPLITTTATANPRLRHVILGNNTGANDLISMSTTDNLRMLRCVLRNIGRSAVVCRSGLQMIGCEVHDWGQSSAAAAINPGNSSAASLIGNYIHDGTGGGVVAGAAGAHLAHNVIAGCSSYGILSNFASVAAQIHLNHNVLYDNESGLSIGSTSTQPIVSRGNLYLANSTYGVRYTGSGAPLFTSLGDAFWNNTSGEIQSPVQVEELLARLTLSADPLVDAAGGDFRVRAAAGLRRAGWPSTYLSAAAMTARWAWIAAGLPSHGPAAKGGRVFGGLGG